MGVPLSKYGQYMDILGWCGRGVRGVARAGRAAVGGGAAALTSTDETKDVFHLIARL